MVKALMVGMGGFAGSICRYLVYEASYLMFNNAWLPYATLVVNIVGCLIIGFLGGMSEIRQIFSPELRALVFIGFLGGFTTFSTFGFEIYTMMANGRMVAALTTIGLHLVLGVAAVWLGWHLAVS
ncbi:MAG: fluoride efflux transporter CrcB [Desulfobacterales bacterium]|nr:fluoride efflux transporter CrcB [Desulfobacterales bacterium]